MGPPSPVGTDPRISPRPVWKPGPTIAISPHFGRIIIIAHSPSIINVNLKHRKRLRLVDFEYKGDAFVYFLTLCTSQKQPYLADERIANVIEDELEFRRLKEQIRLYSYCIMPDHLHLLISFSANHHIRLQDWVSAFKRYTSKSVYDFYGIRPLWQRNFYDHIVRKKESLIQIAEYIVDNPVRKGMVDEWDEYPYSKIFDAVL